MYACRVCLHIIDLEKGEGRKKDKKEKEKTRRPPKGSNRALHIHTVSIAPPTIQRDSKQLVTVEDITCPICLDRPGSLSDIAMPQMSCELGRDIQEHSMSLLLLRSLTRHRHNHSSPTQIAQCSTYEMYQHHSITHTELVVVSFSPEVQMSIRDSVSNRS